MITLRCQCRNDDGGRCHDIIATIKNGVLMLSLRHHGEEHVTPITLPDLDRMMKEDKARRDPALQQH